MSEFEVFDDFEEESEEVVSEVEVRRTSTPLGQYTYDGVTYQPSETVVVSDDVAEELLSLRYKGFPVFVRTA